MALNGSKQSIIDHRRQLVARLRLRGASQRDIVDALPKQTMNGSTGLPWSAGTIHYDIKAIEEAWQKSAQIDIAQHKSNVLAELAEVKRQAWGISDIGLVLKAIAQERALLGLDAATKTDIVSGGAPIKIETIKAIIPVSAPVEDGE